MSLFRKRKEGKPTPTRTLKIEWDPRSKLAVLHYKRGRVRHKRTIHAESLADAEAQIELWLEERPD